MLKTTPKTASILLEFALTQPTKQVPLPILATFRCLRTHIQQLLKQLLALVSRTPNCKGVTTKLVQTPPQTTKSPPTKMLKLNRQLIRKDNNKHLPPTMSICNREVSKSNSTRSKCRENLTRKAGFLAAQMG